MKHRLTMRLLLALAAAAAPLPTLAEARASVTLGDFGWSLVDLRPGDGLAPWVRFDTDRFDANGVLGLSETGLAPGGQPLPRPVQAHDAWKLLRGQGGLGFFPSVQRATGLAQTQVSIRQGGAPAQHAFSLALEGRAGHSAGDGLWTSSFFGISFPALSVAVGDGRFAIELSPFTELVWTGTLTLEAEKSNRDPALRRERAWAQASIVLNDASGNIADGLHLAVDTRPRPPGLQRESRALHLSLSNPGDAVAYGGLASYAVIGGNTYTNPAVAIPEPAAWALLAGGALVVGAAARRRSPAWAIASRTPGSTA